MSTSARLCSRISRSFWHSRCSSAQRRTSCERWRRARTRIDARTQLRATLETFQRLGATPWSGATRTQTASTTPDDPTGGPTREIRRRAATWSWRRQRPVEPTGHIRSTSRPRSELAVRYPAARPTQRHLASGAGGRVASSLYRRTADRRGHQRRSATMVARRSTPAAAGSPLSRSLPPERSRGERPFRSSRSRKGGVRNREAPSGGGLACTTLASAQTRAPEPESAACAVRTSHERRADRDSGGRPRPPGEASATSVLKFAR